MAFLRRITLVTSIRCERGKEYAMRESMAWDHPNLHGYEAR